MSLRIHTGAGEALKPLPVSLAVLSAIRLEPSFGLAESSGLSGAVDLGSERHHILSSGKP